MPGGSAGQATRPRWYPASGRPSWYRPHSARTPDDRCFAPAGSAPCRRIRRWSDRYRSLGLVGIRHLADLLGIDLIAHEHQTIGVSLQLDRRHAAVFGAGQTDIGHPASLVSGIWPTFLVSTS